MLISVLDQTPVAEGMSATDALHNTLDLAQHAERLGYHRYWLAEHHGSPMLAGPTPEIMIGQIAARTRRLHVGSAGVMLPHYSPFKVAEQFSLLAGLYPDRIDLGVGRAPGTDSLTAYALQRDRSHAAPDDFPSQLSELLGYLHDNLPRDHPFARLARTLPGYPETPMTWLLGSSRQSAIWAGQLGLPYAFADFINPTGATIAAEFHQEYLAAGHPHPSQVAVAVTAICAETEAEAIRLASSSRMAMHQLRSGRLIAVPSPERAIPFLRSIGEDPESVSSFSRRMVVGTPDQVRTGLQQVVADYDADELVVVTIVHDHQARLRSYELIAQAFDLQNAPGVSG